MITVSRNGREHNLKFVEHMLHYRNLESVLTNGLLSHNEAYKRNFIKEDISMAEVQARRAEKNIKIDNRKIGIHDFVSFYFNSKNPMLFKRKNLQHEMVILLVQADLLDTKTSDSKFAIFSDGNAGSNVTKFYSGIDQLKNVDFDLIFSGSWNHEDPAVKTENKRKMCSEVLIYPSIEIGDIQHIICPNPAMVEFARNLKASLAKNSEHLRVEQNTTFFF
jgi:hypothetical protein